LPTILIFLGVLLLWEVAVRAFQIKQFILPAPSAIFEAFRASLTQMVGLGIYTGTEALGGFILGCSLGIGVALLIIPAVVLARVASEELALQSASSYVSQVGTEQSNAIATNIVQAEVALTEFALSLPFLLTAGLWGTETANFVLTSMRVSQLAMHLADNGSRVGDTSTLENRKIYESDINDLLVGSNIQGGGMLDFYSHGRAIISSLQVNDTGEQYIKWQRCKGVLHWTSSYGLAGATVSGMGPAGGGKNRLIPILIASLVIEDEVRRVEEGANRTA
jgi:hypothetical protein